MNQAQLTQSIKSESNRLGFDLVGVCPAVAPNGFGQFLQWLEAGYAGEMLYLEERKEAYRHPESVLPGVTSLVMLGMHYQTQVPAESELESKPGTGRIARYAWGAGDYHDVIHAKLKQLKKFVQSLDESLVVRGVVDTAPLLEREFAELAGIGWRAKNTLVINKHGGSWFFLAALLVNSELEYDDPIQTDHCGTCTACLDACPTDAFVQPHVLDATKCISYLTIEHRSPIPVELRPMMENWILGCDVCQEVCPWNRKSPLSQQPEFAPLEEHNPIELRSLFDLDDDQFRARFRKTPLWRPKRRGILRNAAIALGNFPSSDNVASLCKGLNDGESLIRGASAWALGQHQDSAVRPSLQARLELETDEQVRGEIRSSLEVTSS